MTENITISVRDIDKELYRQARADAIKHGQTIAQWLNEAMKGRLQKNKA